MAALTRRTWQEILDEVADRLGHDQDTSIDSTSGRAAHWIDYAYRIICLLWHHYELDDVDTSVTLSSGTRSASLPADTHIVMGVGLATSGGSQEKRLVHKSAKFLLQHYTAESAKPDYYTRFGDTLYFDTEADQSYDLSIYRYKEPGAPDYASGSPAIDRLFDYAIIEGAVYLGQRALWRPDLSGSTEQSLMSFLQKVVNPPLAAGPMVDTDERRTTDRSHGGAQG